MRLVIDLGIMGAKTGAAPKIRKLKMRYPELSAGQIAKRVGCSATNVYGVLETFLGDNTEEQLRNYQDNQADAFDSLAMRSLESITAAKLLKANAVQLMTVAGIATDKARLVRGQATGINVSVLMDVVDAIKARKA